MTAAGHVNGQIVFFEGPFVNRLIHGVITEEIKAG